MSELDHASLEASKKLVDNGIVLSEVDFMWFEHEVGEWILMSSDSVSIKAFKDGHAYPAPCFTDVWRELPEEYINKNPTDALIDLLVWLKGQFERRNP